MTRGPDTPSPITFKMRLSSSAMQGINKSTIHKNHSNTAKVNDCRKNSATRAYDRDQQTSNFGATSVDWSVGIEDSRNVRRQFDKGWNLRGLTRSHSFSKSITMKSSKQNSNCSIFRTEVLGNLSSSMDDASRSSPRHVLMESPQKPQSPLSAMLEDNQKTVNRCVSAAPLKGSFHKHPPTARLAKR
jgi:hypothetical protein